jgi:hypothetical protein
MNVTFLKISAPKRALTISLVLILLIASFSAVSAQSVRDEKPPLKERLFFGGNFGLLFGTITNIQISPVVGLWVLPRVSVAAGPEYWFYKDHYSSTNVYGGKIYSEFVLVKDLNSMIPMGVHTGIFLHLEDELLNLESAEWKNQPDLNGRFYLNSVLAGGGLSQQIGARSSMNFTLLWQLNPSIYSIYSNPEIRISFNF